MNRADRSVAFLADEVPLLLAKLTPQTPAKWGRMTPQHMIEHLQYVLGLSRGIKMIPVLTPWYKQIFYKWYLLSNRPFPKNISVPGRAGKSLPPLRYKSLEEAKANLISSIEDTIYFFRKSPEIRTSHPLAGKFTPDDWRIFHAKHFRHHFIQFGLLS